MTVTILKGDCRDVLRGLPAESVHCIVTSPPYFGLRDYGVAGQIGLEPTPAAYVAELVNVLGAARRVLRDDGTLWLNLGDSYNSNSDMTRNDVKAAAGLREQPRKQRAIVSGIKPKDLIGIPWRVAFALQADGWHLRQDIIWSKPNPMPESVRDRCTKAHEYLFLLSKCERYYYDADAIKTKSDRAGEIAGTGPKSLSRGSARGANVSPSGNAIDGGFCISPEMANRRSVWEVPTQPFPDAHFATFPPALIEPCIRAGCPKGGTVLDPFGGAGTTALVADREGRNGIIIEINPEYAAMAERRIKGDAGMFADVAAE